jgi:hypothetical protein
MALKKCRECKQKVSNHALSCPHCGYRKVKHEGPLGWFLGLPAVGKIFLVSLFFVFFIVDHYLPDEWKAFSESRGYVEEQLGSTVRFCNYSETEIRDLGNGRFRVAAYFEKDDLPGSEKRTAYVCVLSKNESGAWSVEELDM